MGRIIAISSGDLQSTAPINEYAVKLVKGNTKNLLFTVRRVMMPGGILKV